MKTKLLILLLMVLPCFGADSKVSDLPELTDTNSTDLMYIIDVNSNPTSKKITVGNLLADYLTAETDPCFALSDVNDVTSTDIANWNTAYGWGDWSGEGFITTYSETDPCFALSDVNDVTSTDISNWNTAYGWGDWSGEGFLTAESDPCFVASDVYSVTSTNISNWNTAYGWGDWSGQGFLSAETGVEANDLVVIDSNSVLAEKMKHINITLISPADITCADMIPVWHNTSGYTFHVKEIHAWADADDVSLEVEEIPSETDFSSPTQVQAVEIATDGTDCFYYQAIIITAPAIETEHLLAIDFDTNDDPNYVKLTITGYYSD